MRFFRKYRFVLLFLVLLVFCSVMVIRQFRINDREHEEVREAFILLYIKGYQPEAEKLYQRLLRDAPDLSARQLLDDFQRTLLLVDPISVQTNNLIYNYHWYVSKQLDIRSESTLLRARKLAEESD
ncbi:MAG: hypothetical protein H0X66_16705 [Verrucomicrobia bacterium]|nr:hypothetical protein [Verrucomicrobiota bacterium]